MFAMTTVCNTKNNNNYIKNIIPSTQRMMLILTCTMAIMLTLQRNTIVAAKIATTAIGRDGGGGLTNAILPYKIYSNSGRCSMRKFTSIAKSIDDIEDLDVDVPVNIAFENRQKKRFVLYLNSSTPLTINFSQDVARKIYFNETTNLSRSLRPEQRTILLPCALRGQYDLFVQAKQRGSIKIEAHAAHPHAQRWPLLNRTNDVSIRNQNRVRKRQMIVKWDKSKFDFHTVHYCLVVSMHGNHKDFCSAVNDYVTSVKRKGSSICFSGAVMDYIWLRPPERSRKIDPRITNIICTGSRTQQVLRGLVPNHTYYLDIFGVHTRRQNLTFHISSTQAQFNRTQPATLREDELTMEKISGMNGVQVFSFKVPARSVSGMIGYRHQSMSHLRYLILPCGGSEVNTTVLKQRKLIGHVSGIYRPTYLKIPLVHEGERYMVRFSPGNEDEVLRANKVGLAVTTSRVFSFMPELPENITVFEMGSRCKWTTIAWYSSPEIRTMSYCVIVFNLPQRNRSSIDYTNYCMDFGKRVMQHPQFHSIKCSEKAKNPPPLETQTIFNLTPGESYLIYVTANLSEGKPLPYQSLFLRKSHQCYDLLDSREQTAYY